MDAIYARQSIDKKDSISIETQIDLCKREVQSISGYELYSDKGYSGSNLKRPEFQRLLEDIRQGKIERVIVYRLDRISRSVLDFANLIELFDEYGVSFSSTQEKFDTGTPIGKAMLNITMVFAQLERETIQQRIRDNYYSRGEKGMYLGGPAPFGFSKTESMTEHGKLKHLIANPETASVLRRMYELYGEQGETLGEIARVLNGEQVPSPNGKSWDSCKVSRILRNPVAVRADATVFRYYKDKGCKVANEPSEFIGECGGYLYGKREASARKYTDVTDHTLSLAPHEGLVSAELFMKCQRRLDENKQVDNRKRSQITWLTGLIKCGKCEHSAVPKSSNMGKYYYLYCTGKTSYSCCNVEGNLGSMEVVEAVVAEKILSWSDKYSNLRAGAAAVENKERNKLMCRVEEIDVAIGRLMDTLAESGSITAKYLNEKIEEMDAERRALLAEADKLGDKQLITKNKEIADLRGEWDTLSLHQKNQIASMLINRILLFRDEIVIEWSYDFEAEEKSESSEIPA